MPVSVVLSSSSDHRTTLSHYAPGEECRPHRHAWSQASLLIAGDYLENSDEGRREVGIRALTRKPGGYEHEDVFGDAGALIVSLNAPVSCIRESYRIVICDSLAAGRAELQSMHAGDEASPNAAIPPTQAPQWLLDAKVRLLEDRTMVRAFARSLGRHPVSFARSFRRAFGVTPSQCRQDRRLARAMTSVVRSPTPLAEIADAEGFADQAHMTRAFTAASGWSPAALRRLFRKL
jgi:AraC family transcriptional regulator